ncbi:MAG: hypothetical protein AUK47_13890 [Deltaproteobacteria bacterium CG2_30_63_29]|nr:MAG: hypothetical protein AUK47_13890 [Deltaproteobacteria bacterium CG2_30_63_29]PJB48642.1 MAG: hypothetical protein CO108_01905 [Deltaproteobacteria bacterium CG_4_9_14_3_um_filter_63_12]
MILLEGSNLGRLRAANMPRTFDAKRGLMLIGFARFTPVMAQWTSCGVGWTLEAARLAEAECSSRFLDVSSMGKSRVPSAKGLEPCGRTCEKHFAEDESQLLYKR